MKNLKFSIGKSLFSILFLLPLSSCQKPAASPKPIKNFPSHMVGTWEAQAGILETQKWQIKLEKDGTISKITHHVFGKVDVMEGGVYKDGPDPNTYMFFALGPTDVQYDSNSDTLNIKIVIDDFEAKFPEGGMLKGRMIDTLIGKTSVDGQVWTADWRSYGWLKGAQEPDIDFIDKNPEVLVFKKTEN